MTQIVCVMGFETVGTPIFLEYEYPLTTPFLRAVLAIHPIQNRSGMGNREVLKSLKVFYLPNNPNNSKSSCPQGHVGSNPTRSAKETSVNVCLRRFSY